LFGGVVFLSVYVFLAVVSVALFRRRRGALRLVWWLLGLELFGAFMLLSIFGGDVVVLVAVCWTAPNAFAFYKQLARFAELENEKPGD
jgi:hypothetical protein